MPAPSFGGLGRCGIEVGPEFMSGDAGDALDIEHPLGGDALPLGNCLRGNAAQQPRELRAASDHPLRTIQSIFHIALKAYLS